MFIQKSHFYQSIQTYSGSNTGHAMLYPFGLINMNDRMYDTVLARMLSPDNYVQSATFSQSFNRYSYCWNNPMAFTDQSGQAQVGTSITDKQIAAQQQTDREISAQRAAWMEKNWQFSHGRGGSIIAVYNSDGSTFGIGTPSEIAEKRSKLAHGAEIKFNRHGRPYFWYDSSIKYMATSVSVWPDGKVTAQFIWYGGHKSTKIYLNDFGSEGNPSQNNLTNHNSLLESISSKYYGMNVSIDIGRYRGYYNPITNTAHIPGPNVKTQSIYSKLMHDYILHEFGHYLQYIGLQKRFGSYYGAQIWWQLIGIPSILTTPSKNHLNFLFETSANKLSVDFFNKQFYNTETWKTKP